MLADPTGGKLAGILAEVAAPTRVIVVGIGLNVSLTAPELPTEQATSLRLLGAAALDRVTLAATVLDHLRGAVEALQRAGGADEELMAQYTARSVTIGARVRAILPGDDEVVGEATAVDDQGRLCIDTGSRTRGTVVVAAGDIVHLRPVAGGAG